MCITKVPHDVMDSSGTKRLSHYTIRVCCIPYIGKFSWEKIFENFVNYRLFAKILSANVLFSVDKDSAIALIRENIIREMLYLAHLQKFSSAKISRYKVSVIYLRFSEILPLGIKHFKTLSSKQKLA